MCCPRMRCTICWKSCVSDKNGLAKSLVLSSKLWYLKSGYGILFYHPEMERINRITQMEQILDAAIGNSNISGQDLKLLTEYYEGPLWREDFEADEAGKLPKELKRGVLSEDAVYNLLEELRER